jgi:hypothetical protein
MKSMQFLHGAGLVLIGILLVSSCTTQQYRRLAVEEYKESENVGLLDLHTGSVEENGGWFTSLSVEYRDRSGDWQSVDDLVISPSLMSGDERFNKPHFAEYLLAFKPVVTSAIRIIGKAGGVEHLYSTFTRFVSITELSTHGPLPDYHALVD